MNPKDQPQRVQVAFIAKTEGLEWADKLFQNICNFMADTLNGANGMAGHTLDTADVCAIMGQVCAVAVDMCGGTPETDMWGKAAVTINMQKSLELKRLESMPTIGGVT